MPILITTSRRPTRRSRRLAKELCRVVPYFHKVNRGNMGYRDIRDYMIRKGLTKLIIIENYKGNPGALEFLTIDEYFIKRLGRLRIESLSLQVDVKRDYFLTGLKKVDFMNLDKEAEDLLKQFFFPYLSLKEGDEGRLIIKQDSSLHIIFYKNGGVKIPPIISGRLVIYE